MKILIVDDEPLVRRSLARGFQASGHEVSEAKDGVDGEEVWLRLQPDIVVLDVLMPGMSGPQLIEKVKGRHKSRIVLISAYSGEYDVDSAKGLGADLFIAKPFDDVFAVVKQVEDLK